MNADMPIWRSLGAVAPDVLCCCSGAPRGAMYRVGGERTPPLACRSRSLKLGAARAWGRRRGWEQPRQRRDGSVPPDGPGPASETGRCKRSLNQWVKLLNQHAGSNLVDVGRSAVHDHHLWVVDSEAGSERRWGGHGEGLRRTRGEAAGAKLDASPVDRCMVNVGTISGSPSPSSSQGGGGQVRRRLMSPGWGGALVVVRGRESRPHGEGGQRICRERSGMPGGRR